MPHRFSLKCSRLCQIIVYAVGVLVLAAVGASAPSLIRWVNTLPRSRRVLAYLKAPQEHRDWQMPALVRCGNAPFLFPTRGYIGYLWDDSFRLFHRHQGIDIFGGTAPGVTPVYAAYDGFLTRLPDWKASVIIRIPHYPRSPQREIWTYYTHMAGPWGKSFISKGFPPGSREVFVRAGTLLGYQGNYSGKPGLPVGVHLHFSIVLSDERGGFRNELKIANTLDPSPYFGFPLNGNKVPPDQTPLCPPQERHTPRILTSFP